jgi:ubiquinone/menaquinone biosynthesis C-methylase UbiE
VGTILPSGDESRPPLESVAVADLEFSAYTDRTSLTTEAYADPRNLNSRIALYEFQRPRHDLIGQVVRLLHDAGNTVVDIGCGPGHYAKALRADRPGRTVVAVDLSPGMVAAAGRPGVVADATALPLATRSVDAAIATHMLYHVPRPEEALAELARVTKPAGTVVLSTNAIGDKRELRELHARAAEAAGATAPSVGVGMRFNLDEAETVAMHHFTTVERIDLQATIEASSAEPIVAFIASTAAWYRDRGRPEPADGEVLLAHARRLADEVIAADGAFRIRTHSGILVCR